MTNPNNSVGTNAAYDGRTSVNAFNDVLGLLPRGVLSGWACVPKSGLTVSIGGVSGTRDVAIAEDNNGNRTTINNIPGTPIDVTISAAPGANSRIDLIVAYVDNPPTGVSTTSDNPAACGLITVEGTAAATPTAPDDSDIRTAITADGASGTTAYYVVLAQVTIASGTTDIDGSMISSGGNSGVGAQNIDFTTLFDVLYYNPSGTTGNIVLSKSAANYARLRIFFCDNTNKFSSIDVYSPNGKTVQTTVSVVTQSPAEASYTKSTAYTINGTSFNISGNYQGEMGVITEGESVKPAFLQGNHISITRIEGWRF